MWWTFRDRGLYLKTGFKELKEYYKTEQMLFTMRGSPCIFF